MAKQHSSVSTVQGDVTPAQVGMAMSSGVDVSRVLAGSNNQGDRRGLQWEEHRFSGRDRNWG